MRRASRIYIINGYHYESRNCVLDYSPMNQMEISHFKKQLTRLMFQIKQKKVFIVREKGI